MAWLDATPEPLKGQESHIRTRREELGAHYITKLPEIDTMHLVEWWESLGRYEMNGVGMAPLSFGEILAWSELTGIMLSEDEPNIIKTLSCDYISMYNQGRNRDCPAPYTPEMTQEDAQRARDHTAEQMRRLKEGALNG